MSKGSRFGMAFHQGLGFSKALMKVPKAEAVFWPGCALMTLDGEILEKTLDILRRAEPEIQMACVNATDGGDVHELGAAMTEFEGVMSVTVNKDVENSVGKMLEALDLVVVTIVIFVIIRR